MAFTVTFFGIGEGGGEGDGDGAGPLPLHHCRPSFFAHVAHAALVVVVLQWLWQWPTCLQCWQHWELSATAAKRSTTSAHSASRATIPRSRVSRFLKTHFPRTRQTVRTYVPVHIISLSGA